MESIFLKVFNMNITASWMILAVIVIRWMMKRSKVPKWISCTLWALAAVRLICPFSFESVMSLIPSAQVITQETLFSETPSVDTGVMILNQAVNPVIERSMTPAPGTSVNPLQIWTFVMSNIWFLGIVFMIGYAFISCLRLHKKVQNSIRLKKVIDIHQTAFNTQDAQWIFIKQSKQVWLCDHIDSPFILGIIRPKIYLPSSMDSQWMAAVLQHEVIHIQRKDHWWKPLGYLLLSIYWFNPLVWIAYILLCRDIEMACDEKVVKDMDADAKRDYSNALFNCSISRKQICACPLAFGEVGVKERIKSVLNYKKPTFWIVVISILICTIIGICFLTNPKKDKKLHIQEADEMISQSSGWEDVEIFSLDDSVNGYVFAGYTTQRRTGIAYFRFDKSKQDYVLLGYQENFRERPFAVTLGEYEGLNHSVTIAASESKNVSYIQMEYGDEVKEIGVSVQPSLVSWEWDILIEETDDVAVRFCDAHKHELSLESSMVPYEQNKDGTWTADGYIYKYRLELTGQLPNAALDSCYTVLTNDSDITFERVAKSLFSSNSEDILDRETARLVDLETGVFEKATEFRHLEEVKGLLSVYSDELPELVSEACYVVLHGDSYSGEEYWEYFYECVGSNTPAEVVIVQFTTEGDPILDYIQYNGESFYRVQDISRDEFGGSQEPYQEYHYSYLKAYEPILENGDICRYVYLTDQEDITLEEIFEKYEISSRIEEPPFSHVLYAVLGNINTSVCEVLDLENEATTYAEEIFPVEEISKIEVLNGNTGRIVTLVSGTDDFEHVIAAYQNLEYEPIDGQEEVWRSGYLYRMTLYDQEDMIIQEITPYVDMLRINGNHYDAGMNRTAADLIIQLELLF